MAHAARALAAQRSRDSPTRTTKHEPRLTISGRNSANGLHREASVSSSGRIIRPMGVEWEGSTRGSAFLAPRYADPNHEGESYGAPKATRAYRPTPNGAPLRSYGKLAPAGERYGRWAKGDAVEPCEYRKEELRRLHGRWTGPESTPGPGEYAAEAALDFARKKHAASAAIAPARKSRAPDGRAGSDRSAAAGNRTDDAGTPQRGRPTRPTRPTSAPGERREPRPREKHFGGGGGGGDALDGSDASRGMDDHPGLPPSEGAARPASGSGSFAFTPAEREVLARVASESTLGDDWARRRSARSARSRSGTPDPAEKGSARRPRTIPGPWTWEEDSGGGERPLTPDEKAFVARTAAASTLTSERARRASRERRFDNDDAPEGAVLRPTSALARGHVSAVLDREGRASPKMEAKGRAPALAPATSSAKAKTKTRSRTPVRSLADRPLTPDEKALMAKMAAESTLTSERARRASRKLFSADDDDDEEYEDDAGAAAAPPRAESAPAKSSSSRPSLDREVTRGSSETGAKAHAPAPARAKSALGGRLASRSSAGGGGGGSGGSQRWAAGSNPGARAERTDATRPDASESPPGSPLTREQQDEWKREWWGGQEWQHEWQQEIERQHREAITPERKPPPSDHRVGAGATRRRPTSSLSRRPTSSPTQTPPSGALRPSSQIRPHTSSASFSASKMSRPKLSEPRRATSSGDARQRTKTEREEREKTEREKAERRELAKRRVAAARDYDRRRREQLASRGEEASGASRGGKDTAGAGTVSDLLAERAAEAEAAEAALRREWKVYEETVRESEEAERLAHQVMWTPPKPNASPQWLYG